MIDSNDVNFIDNMTIDDPESGWALYWKISVFWFEDQFDRRTINLITRAKNEFLISNIICEHYDIYQLMIISSFMQFMCF